MGVDQLLLSLFSLVVVGNITANNDIFVTRPPTKTNKTEARKNTNTIETTTYKCVVNRNFHYSLIVRNKKYLRVCNYLYVAL